MTQIGSSKQPGALPDLSIGDFLDSLTQLVGGGKDSEGDKTAQASASAAAAATTPEQAIRAAQAAGAGSGKGGAGGGQTIPGFVDALTSMLKPAGAGADVAGAGVNAAGGISTAVDTAAMGNAAAGTGFMQVIGSLLAAL